MSLKNTETLTHEQAKAVYTAFKALSGIDGDIDNIKIGRGLQVWSYMYCKAIGVIVNGLTAAEYEDLDAFRKAYKLRK